MARLWATTGRLALSASEGETLKVWDTATGTLLATFPGEDAFLCGALDAGGRLALAGDLGSGVYFLRVEGR